MINIYPNGFLWPTTGTQDPVSIPLGDYQVLQIIDVLKQNFGGDYSLVDATSQTQLEAQYQLSQCGLMTGADLNLYAIAASGGGSANQVTVNISIDNAPCGQVQVQSDSTIKELIESVLPQLGYNQFPHKSIVQNSIGQVVATDVSFQFCNIQTDAYNLLLYITQAAPIYQAPMPAGNSSVGGKSQGPQNKSANEEAKELLNQLVVLPNMSLLVDKEGRFVVYKYHLPIRVNGYLEQEKGKESKNKNIDNQYDFVEKNKVKLAANSEYGVTIKWPNGKYSSVRVKQQN